MRASTCVLQLASALSQSALAKPAAPAHYRVPQVDKQVIGSGLASLWLLRFTRAWVRCRSG